MTGKKFIKNKYWEDLKVEKRTKGHIVTWYENGEPMALASCGEIVYFETEKLAQKLVNDLQSYVSPVKEAMK